MSVKHSIIDLLGKQSKSDNDLQKRMRLHQSWLRTCVLAAEQGLHPINAQDKIGSSILDGDQSNENFIDGYAINAVKDTFIERGSGSKGLIKEDRLYNNLLSSQPLCFNFFGRLKYDKKLATKLFQQFFPDIKRVINVFFEFTPTLISTSDNSAHDIAIEFLTIEGKTGMIGLECKYTEPFSPKEYDRKEYLQIFNDSKAFSAEYKELINTKYNQLFRNQLIIENVMLKSGYDVAYSGLFCYQGDDSSIFRGNAFQKMLKNGEERFKIITFANFIQTIQRMDIDWETREWSMMLWARYCGTELSKRFHPKPLKGLF
jgi:hypothetical protein